MHRAIAGRILEIESELPLAIPLAELCAQLDVNSITEVDTNGFEAALVMDVNKAVGAIRLASNRSPQRRRYSNGHELGHFLIPTHRPQAGQGFECQLDDLHRLDLKEQNRRRRIEAEANRFAAALLMPPSRFRSRMRATQGLADIVALANEFEVSKEAMARAYVDASREPIAVLILHKQIVTRVYRNADFPWISARIGQPVPHGSIASDLRLPRSMSEPEECDPEIWLSERDCG